MFSPIKWSRRAFLKKGIALGVLLSRPLFTNRLFGNGKKTFLPSWISLVEDARWCPSLHNLQPHKLKVISETEAELYYDPKRLLPVGDPQSIFSTVAMGIFIESLSIAAGSNGFEVSVAELFSPISTNTSGPKLFAKLTLVERSVKEVLEKDLLKQRRTSRLPFDGRALPLTVLTQLGEQAKQFGHNFSFSLSTEETDFVIDLNQQTLFDDLRSDAERMELEKLFRYTDEEAALKKDGLWAKCFGFKGSLLKSVFKDHELWERGLRRLILKERYKSSFTGTATIGWFHGRFDETSDWLLAGRMLARNWLLLTKNGAYMHPFGSLITNTSANEKLTKRLVKDEETLSLWFVFRAGYSKIPARSYRLKTEEILIT